MQFTRRTILSAALGGGIARGQAVRSRALEQRLLRHLESLETVDTHEHIIPEKERVAQPADFFLLAGHYAINDVISAGLPESAQKVVNDPKARMSDKWKAFEPFWRDARYTGYGEALRIAIRDIYGFPEITAANLERINEAIAAKNRPGLYDDVLRRRSKIRFAVNDEYWNPTPVVVDSRYFVLARKFDRYCTPITPAGVGRLEKLVDLPISSVAGLKRALEKSFEQSIAAGMVTVKSTIAYERDLLFQETSAEDAERDFQNLVKGEVTAPPEGFRRHTNRPFRRMEDHMYHHLIRLAEAHDVPVQIHTGLHAGNGNFITNSNPTLLTNLFFLFPKVRFDLFHMGYPYQGELAALAKLFPNVHVDLCWTHIISPSATKRAMHEFLDTVPQNKVFAFGGDYRYPELSYAHLVMARRNVAEVLAERVEAGVFPETEAARIGTQWFVDNPARLFTPKKPRQPA